MEELTSTRESVHSGCLLSGTAVHWVLSFRHSSIVFAAFSGACKTRQEGQNPGVSLQHIILHDFYIVLQNTLTGKDQGLPQALRSFVQAVHVKRMLAPCLVTASMLSPQTGVHAYRTHKLDFKGTDCIIILIAAA